MRFWGTFWVIASCIILFANPSVAQKIRLGVRVLPSFVGLSNSEDKDNRELNPDATTGIGLGFAIGYKFSEKFELELDVLYSSQGQNYQLYGLDSIQGSAFVGYRLKLGYVKFPLLLRYRYEVDKKTTAIVYAGPQFSLLADAQETIIVDKEESPVDYGSNGITTLSKYSGSDLGAVFGLEVEFKVTDRINLYTGLRADIGFKDVENKALLWQPTGFTEESYYQSYYGPKLLRDVTNVGDNPRTAKSTNYAVGFTVGFSYILNTKRNPNDYYW